MYQHLEIEHFRGIETLKVTALGQTTLIGGKNGAGKTSVLEALFIHGQPFAPQVLLTVETLRGLAFSISQVALPAPMIPWSNLFRFSQMDVAAQIVGSTTDKGAWSVTLEHRQSEVEPKSVTLTQAGQPVPGATQTVWPSHELVITYRPVNGQQLARSILITADGNVIGQSPAHPPLVSASYWATPAPPHVEAQRFNKLAIARKDKELLGALRTIEPALRSLTAGFQSDGSAAIFADVGGPQLIPATLLGDGFYRLLSYMLAVMDEATPLVLIDEIENGLHYTAYKQTWQALTDMCIRRKVQLIATTHSREFLYAAAEAADADRFLYIRLDRDVESGEARAEYFRTHELDVAERVGVEVR